MLALGMMALVAGALRLAAAAMMADATARRGAIYWLLAGALASVAPF